MNSCPAEGLTKSNSLSLHDSLRQRSNSLRVSPQDDILLRRSNSLRQGLGMGMGGRRYHEEIGLPNVSRTVPATPSTRHTRVTHNDCINFEVTPPDDGSANHGGNGGGCSNTQAKSLQGTIV